MTRRSLRHPIRGDHRYLRPGNTVRWGQRRTKVRQPRLGPKRGVNVAAMVGAPEERPYRANIRLRVVGLAVLVLFAVMIFRLWSLQVIDAHNYAAAVVRNQIRTVSVPAPRGLIVDRSDTVLAGNQSEEEITISQVAASQHPEVIGQLAALIGETPAQVSHTVNNERFGPYQPVPVLTDAPAATIEYLEDHAASFPGVSVQEISQRSYPQGGTLAPQVLGYLNTITGEQLAKNPNVGYTQASVTGQGGLEEEYEAALRGEAGTDSLSVTPHGQVVGTVHTTRPQQGDTLVLNMDVGLQNALQSYLNQQIAADRVTPDPTTHVDPAAVNGAAIVMDPQTGAVLAMASYPSYDLNVWVGGISSADYGSLNASGAMNNYAVSGEYTPGSTFKLITATAALQDGIIGANQFVDDTGSFTVPGCQGTGAAGCSFHDDEAVGAGEIDLPSALTMSDDYYFYNLGYDFWQSGVRAKFGDEAVQDVAASYGLGKVTGVDLPLEASGTVDSPAVRQAEHKADPSAYPNDTWYTGDNIEMAFGQGGTVLTPIGVADAYATFANGGTHYQPEVAAAIVNPVTGAVVQGFDPKATGHVDLPPSTSAPILAGLQGVIDNGSGTAAPAFNQYAKFAYNSFPLAGKTGTADNAGQQEPNSWFVAFGPLPNPQYLVLCVIGQGGYGADAAAPVVFNTFNYLVTNPVGPVKLPSPQAPASNAAPLTNPAAGTPTSTSPTTIATAPHAPTTTTAPSPPTTATTTTTAPSPPTTAAPSTTTTTTQPPIGG